MDMFYAAVEMRDDPGLRGKPLVVGGKPDSRGVVCAANYEARKYGIHSAMSCAVAYRKCPFCLFIPPHFDKYRKVSQEIREIFYSFTDLVEPLSLDEAYLDVTENKVGEGSATLIARAIKRMIYEKTGLTASAGVAPNKFIAKIASDYKKPDGLWVVAPSQVLSFIRGLAVVRVPGIGKVMNEKLQGMGIAKISDLSEKSLSFLLQEFGKTGSYLYNIAQGIDEREVKPHRERQSYGRETTFERDIESKEEVLHFLEKCSRRVFQELTDIHRQAKTVTLKIKYYDFQTMTRRVTAKSFFSSAEEIFHHIQELLEKTEVGEKPIRLAGVSLSGFPSGKEKYEQLEFCFDDENFEFYSYCKEE